MGTLDLGKMYSNQQTPPQVRCPSGSFWWKNILKLFNNYKSISVCIPNKGDTVVFWLESWAGNSLKLRFPQLFSFVKKPKASLYFMINNEMDRIFSLPLSSQAAPQLVEVQELVNNLHLNPETHGT